jgi:hypothetical protein
MLFYGVFTLVHNNMLLHLSVYLLLQVKLFLHTIDMNPPTVSAAGFASVNRGLFRAVSAITP